VINIAEMYRIEIGNYNKAAEEYEKIAILISEIHGNNSDEYIWILSTIGYNYLLDLRDYEKAINVYEKIIEIEEERFGKNSEEFKNVLFYIAERYSKDIQDIHLSIKKLEKLATVLEKIKNINHYSGYTDGIHIAIYDYVSLLSTISYKYRQLDDMDNSLKYCLKIADIQLSTYGKNSDEHIEALEDIAECLTFFNNYKECLVYYNKIADIHKKNNQYNKYLYVLRKITDIYDTKLNDYAASITKYLENQKYIEDKCGKNSYQYVDLLDELKHKYANVKDTLNVQKISTKIDGILLHNLESIKLINGNYSEYINQLKKFAGDFSVRKNTVVLDKFNEILNNYKNLKNYNNKSYWKGLVEIGNVYAHYSGSFNDAIKLYVECAEIAFDNNNIESCSEMLDKATGLGGSSDYYAMIKVYERCVELSKKINDEDKYSRFSHQIAELYKRAGDYNIAIDKYTELDALERVAKIYEENLQDYEMAINIYLKLEEKNIPKQGYIKDTEIMNKIAFIYSRKLKDYNKAMSYYQKIAKEYINSNHEDNYSCLNALRNIAYILMLDKEVTIDNKIKECTHILNILDKHPTSPVDMVRSMSGAKFSHYLYVLYVLADSYYAKGEYQKVIDYSKRIFAIPDYAYDNNCGYDCKYYKYEEEKIYFYDFIVRSLYNLGKNNEAQKYHNTLMESVKKIVTDKFINSTEIEREKFWNKNQPQAMFLSGSIGLQSNDFQSKFIGDIFNANLFLKGILLNSSMELNKIILESGNSDLIEYFNRYKAVCGAIAQGNDNKSLYDERDILDKKLTQMSQDYGNFMRFTKIKWQDIQAKLNNNELAVDFINFPVNEKETKYAALLLKKDWENPLFVPLCSEQELQGLIGNTAMYKNPKLREMIWNPVLKHIENDTTIYFSASGLLHQIAIEYLPARDSVSINEVYNIHRLSSMRQLMDREQKQSVKNPTTLFGGIDYDVKITENQSENVDKIKDTQSDNQGRSINLFQIDDSQREAIVANFKGRGNFPAKFLPGTKKEIENIAQLLAKEKIDTLIFQGNTATETSFKKLSGKQSDIVIATHGFYLSKEDIVKLQKDTINLLFIDKENNMLSTVEEKAMTRSGLLFAGANNTLLNKPVLAKDDGILTAKEASLLDLRGVNLVVLSACQTGLGEIASEGIFGLQRGFKKAGVQTILMSLWKVDDKATQIMMTEFYNAYLKTNDKRKSFLTAQQNLKDYMAEEVHDVPDYEKDRIFNPKTQSREYQTKRAVVKVYPYKEPRYWASFILLD